MENRRLTPSRKLSGAVSLIRSKAKEWGIAPERIGAIGFSAGGRLAIATAPSFNTRSYHGIDATDEVSCRPDFAAMLYSGYLKEKDKDELAPRLHIPKGTPPIFLAHGGADLISDPANSVVMYLALKHAGVPADVHIYAGAAHDFGVRPSNHPCSAWTRSCADWLRDQGFSSRPRDVRLGKRRRYSGSGIVAGRPVVAAW